MSCEQRHSYIQKLVESGIFACLDLLQERVLPNLPHFFVSIRVFNWYSSNCLAACDFFFYFKLNILIIREKGRPMKLTVFENFPLPCKHIFYFDTLFFHNAEVSTFSCFQSANDKLRELITPLHISVCL